MDRDEMLKKLAALGYDVSVFEGLPDDKVQAIAAECLRVDSDEDGEDEGDEGDEEPNATGEEGQPGEQNADEEHEEYASHAVTTDGDDEHEFPKPKDKAEADQMMAKVHQYRQTLAKMEEACKKFGAPPPDRTVDSGNGEVAEPAPGSVPYEEGAPGAAQTTGHLMKTKTPPKEVHMKFSEKDVNRIVSKAVAAAVAETTKKLAPVLQRVEGAEKRVESLDKFAEQRRGEEKRGLIKARLDNLVQQGKVLPSERESANGAPTLDEIAYGLDATVLHKFKEGDKEIELTQLDRFFKMLENRVEILKFSERLKDSGKAMEDQPVDDTAVATKFYEDHRAAYTAAGTTKEEFVELYKKSSPDMRKELTRAS